MDMFGSVLTVVDVDSGALGSSSGCFAAVRTISYNIPFSQLLTFNISGESCFSAGRGVVWCRGSQRCQRNVAEHYIQRRYLQVFILNIMKTIAKFRCHFNGGVSPSHPRMNYNHRIRPGDLSSAQVSSQKKLN